MEYRRLHLLRLSARQILPLYLALVNDYGEENDQGAFGLLGLLCVPAVPAPCFQCINGNNNRLESDYFNINSYGNRYFNR
ncbi:hypothetical protein TPHV1_20172 [Treponema phagedenis]|uniref:Uncharacterized protein n=1 Tax=Treponema phagedenis TaxID=162 RepID=A0A0B7GXH6_TREPH|nr:hypothetical protein TPHV1_20172 [Treponema phagedenis]